MPKIPLYGDRQIQSSGNLGLPRVSLTMPDDRRGAQLQKIAGDIGDIVRRIEEKKDRIAVEEAYGALYDEHRELSYGPDGFFNKKAGQVSDTAQKDYESEQTKLRSSNSKKLKGRQVDDYNRKADALFSRALDSHSRHVAAQYTAADIQAHDADAERFSEEVKLNPGAPLEEQMDVVALGEEAVEQSLRSQGITDGEALKNARKEYTSGVWKDVVLSLADRNPTIAQEKFDAVKEDMNAEDRKTVSDKLASETLRVRSQAATDNIWAENEEDPESGMAAARAITAADERDSVVTRLRSRYSEKDSREKAAYSGYNDDIASQVDVFLRSGQTEDAHDLIDQNRDKLHKSDISSYRTYIDGQSGTRQVKASDQAARVEAMQRIDTGEITGAGQLQREYGGKLTPGDLEEVVKYQLAGGNVGGLKASEAAKWFNIYTDKAAKDRPEAYNIYWDFLKERLVPGQKPTSDDIKSWATEFFSTSGVVENSILLFDRKRTRAQAVKAGDLEDFQPYTNDERDAAVAAMNKHNKEHPEAPVDPNNPKHVEVFVRGAVRQ